jgi:hypothetical protein
MRDWDIDESFKPVHIGIVVAFILSIVAFYVIEITIGSTLTGFYIWIMIAILIITGILFPLLNQQDNRLDNTHMGYNQKPVDRPFFWFGSSEYNRYRIDEGTLQGMSLGYNPHLDTLQELERKQRDSDCEVCGCEVHEHFTKSRDPFYIIEDRKIYRIFGIPVREKILGWETYCSEHKPKNFK